MKNTLLWITGRLGLVRTIEWQSSEGRKQDLTILQLKGEINTLREKILAFQERATKRESQIASLESKNRAQTDEHVAKSRGYVHEIMELKEEIETLKKDVEVASNWTEDVLKEKREHAETIKTIKAKNKALTAKYVRLKIQKENEMIKKANPILGEEPKFVVIDEYHEHLKGEIKITEHTPNNFHGKVVLVKDKASKKGKKPC